MIKTDGFACALKADLFKLRKMKSVWIGLAVMFALMLVLFSVCWILIAILNKMTPIDPSEAMEQQSTLFALSQLCDTFLASFSDTASISLFIAIITCLFVGKDFSNGAVRLQVARGANRTQLFFSKWVTLSILVVAYSAFAILVCGIFTAFNGYSVQFTAQHFGWLVRNFFLQVLCNISTMSIVLAIAYLCRSSGASLGATIGGAIALSIVFGLVASVGALGGGSIEWINFMPLEQTSIAGIMDKFTTSQLCAVIIMPIIYGAIAITVGLLSFLKRDIK